MILNLVKEKLPNIYNSVHQCYGPESFLRIGNETINSSEGVQQGDPLGPFLFSLGIQDDVVNKMESPFNCWYLDDGCLGGNPETFISDLQKIKDTFNSLGLQLNTSKCELFLVDSLYEEDLNWKNSSSSSSNRWSGDFDSSTIHGNFWSIPSWLDSTSNSSNIWSFSSVPREDIVKRIKDLYNGIKVVEKSNLTWLGAPIFKDSVKSVLNPKIEKS